MKATLCAILAQGLLSACGPAADARSAMPPGTEESTRLAVGAAVSATPLPRYGLNLGGPSAWGAEQLLANAIANPGFEAVLDRSLVVVEATGTQKLHRSTGWNTRPAGFWHGATGEVLTGAEAGTRFEVLDDGAAAQPERATLHLNRALPGVRPGDVSTLTTHTSPEVPARWWGQGRVGTAAGATPGSNGQTVARLEEATGTTTVLSSYIDTLERAGRMLPVTGAWQLRLSARSVGERPAQLRIRLAREGSHVFVDQVVTPGPTWKTVQVDFQGREAPEGKGTLSLSLSLIRGTVELDDVFLGEANPGAGGFRQVVVETLRQLKPGYLREWQGQLGDTTANRLAGDTARRPVRYRPGNHEVLHTYSLAQTFALCQAVGARPWLVLPTTLSATEAQTYGEAVRGLAAAHGIDQVVVEFGNENWNPLFASAGFVSVATHAQAAQQALLALRSGFGLASPGGPTLVTSLNARMGDLAAVASLAQLSAVDRVSVSPYFAYALNDEHTLAQQWAQVFTTADGADLRAMAAAIQPLHPRLNAAEVNLHTTQGKASTTVRNAMVAGATSGPALARRLLQGSQAGMTEQAVYALAGFDAFASNGELVRLFGITRDLARASHLRPTGIALGMLNQVAGGVAHTTTCQGPGCQGITALAYGSEGRRWAIVNSYATPRTLLLAQACAGHLPAARLLDGHDPWLNNETTAMVGTRELATHCEGPDLRVDMPAHSLVTVH